MRGEIFQPREPEATPLTGDKARHADDVEDLRLHADRRHQPGVPAQLVDAEGRQYLLDALLQRLQKVGRRGGGLGICSDRVLEHGVGNEGLGPEAQGHHHVVNTPDPGRVQ